MRNRAIKSIALKTRDAHASAASPCVYYKLHETSGVSFADSLGNGPDFALTGTGTPLATLGWVTPNGTDDMLQVSRDDMGILTDICRLDDDYAQIIAGIDFVYDGDATGYEALFTAGVAAAASGGWGICISSGELVDFLHRGQSSSANTDNVFSGYTLNALANTRISIVMELVRKTASTVDAHLYINGTARVSLIDVNLLTSGGTAPYSGPVSSYAEGATIMGYQGVGTVARRLNSAASNGKVARLLLHKSNTRDTTLSAAVAQDMWFAPGDFPRSLRGI